MKQDKQIGFFNRFFASPPSPRASEIKEENKTKELNFAAREKRIADKEKEWAKREVYKQQELKLAEKLETSIKELTLKRHELESQVVGKKEELRQSTNQLRSTIITIKSEEKKLLSRVAQLKSIETDLLEKEALLENKQELLGRKIDELAKREVTISQIEKRVEKTKQDFERQRVNLSKHIETLQTQKIQLHKEVDESEVALREVNREVQGKRDLMIALEKKQKLLAQIEATLLTREHALEEREEQLSGRLKEFTVFEKDFIKKQRDAQQLAVEINAVQEKVSAAQQDLVQLESQYTQRKKVYEQLDLRAADLESKDAKIREVMVLLDQKHQLLTDREVQMVSKDKEFGKRETQFLQLEVRMEKESRQFEDIKVQVAEKQKLFVTLTKQLANIETTKQDIVLKETEIKQREEGVTAKLAELQKIQQSVTEQQAAWSTRYSSLEKNLDELHIEKTRLEESILLEKNELKALSDEWDNRVKIFLENRKYVQDEMKRISRLKLDDLSVLEAKESEIQDIVKEIDADRNSLREEEDAVISKIAELTRIESRIKMREEKLANWEIKIKEQEASILTRLNSAKKLEHEFTAKTARIKQVKELKVSLPKIQAEYQKYSILLEKTRAKLIASGIQLAGKPRRLKEKEQQLAQEESTLKLKASVLEKKEEEIRKEESNLLHEEGALYQRMLSQEARSEIGIGIAIAQPKSAIQDIIDKANSALRSGNLDTATRYAVEAETLSEHLGSDEKKLVYYDIQELKTNIKLAALG